MATTRQRQEAATLAALEASRRQGISGPVLPDPLIRTLTTDRFIEIDEYGAPRITERGQHHLRGLERKGVARSGRSPRRR